MKRLVKIFLLLFLPVFAFGQNFNINVDSTKQALKTAPNDSVSFNLGSILAQYYLERNPDSSDYFWNKCLKLAQLNNKPLDEAVVLLLKEYVLMQLGKLPESYECISKAFKIAENPLNEVKMFGINYNYGFNSHWNAHQMRLWTISSTHHTYGNLLGDMGKTDQQIFHYKESMNISKTIGSTVLLGLSSGNLGNAYFTLGKLDSALLMEQNAEQISIQTNQKDFLGYVYIIIAKIFLKQQKTGPAVKYFHKGIQSAKEQNYLAGLGDCYLAAANFYIDVEKNKDSSLYYSLKYSDVLKSMGLKNVDAYKALSYSYELNNKPDSALKYYKLAIQCLDSTSNSKIENLTKAQSLAFEDQLKLKALEKEKEDTQNKIRTITLLAGLVIMFLVGFLLYRNNIQQKKVNKLLQEQKEETESTLTALKQTQNQLVQKEKLASLGELTAGIAHEIQNPLNFVNNFSELSLDLVKELREEKQKTKDKRDEALEDEILSVLTENQEKINHHGKRASSIVKGMLEHSRASTGEREMTDINKLADEYLRLSYHGLRAKDKNFNSDYKTDFDETIPELNVVPQDIGRVILNLINNAFYAVNERAKQNADNNYAPLVTVSTKRIADKIEIIVKDNGNGIPDKIKEKIFQPFFTTKPTGEGTGLGLSLAYDIITKGHSGELKVESEEGEGSTFTVILRTIL